MLCLSCAIDCVFACGFVGFAELLVIAFALGGSYVLDCCLVVLL